VKEFLFYLLMRTAEKTSNRRPKEHFIGEERLEVGCLLESLMPGDGGTTFCTEKESYLHLGERGAFSIRPNVVWQSRRCHMSF